MSIVFRIEQMVWLCSIAAAVVTGLLLALVLSLSMRLRAAEMMTMFRLGCSRMTIATLQFSEIAITMLTASILATSASWLTFVLASDSLRRMLF